MRDGGVLSTHSTQLLSTGDFWASKAVRDRAFFWQESLSGTQSRAKTSEGFYSHFY